MRTPRWFNRLILTLAGPCLLAGCVSYTEVLRGVEHHLARQNTSAALVQLESVGDKSRNKLLYYMERGMLARMNNDLPASVASFKSAKQLMESLEAISISGSAARISLSEAFGNYRARDFERLHVHSYQALNYLEQGNWDDARVEALQMDLLLRRLGSDGQAKHGGDAFARYLSGLIFEGRSEWSDALIAYRKALQVYEKDGYGIRAPDDLKRRLIYLADRLGAETEAQQFRRQFGIDDHGIEPGKGEIVLVLSGGLAPKRLESSILSQDPNSGKFFRISLPHLQSRPSRIGGATLTVADRSARSFRVDSTRMAAERSLAAELPGLTAKALARNVVKNVVANQAGKESEALEHLINFAGTIFENADTRSWRTLPDTIYIARLSLPPGEHDVRINIGDGRKIRELESISIRQGEIVVLSQHWTGI